MLGRNPNERRRDETETKQQKKWWNALSLWSSLSHRRARTECSSASNAGPDPIAADPQAASLVNSAWDTKEEEEEKKIYRSHYSFTFARHLTFLPSCPPIACLNWKTFICFIYAFLFLPKWQNEEKSRAQQHDDDVRELSSINPLDNDNWPFTRVGNLRRSCVRNTQ